MREALRDLLTKLPSNSTLIEELGPISGDSIALLREVGDGYVWPDLVLDDEATELNSPVLLVTAPGAMGKSAAAQAIASELGMPYLDLARVRVGTGTLTGELSKALGFAGMGKFLDELKAGRAALVLDSVDEAQLAVGRENFEAFLADLAWLLSDAVAARQVIILGRRDSIETTLLGLMDCGLPAPLYRVAPLSRIQVNELIEKTLDGKSTESGLYNLHRIHPMPFAAYRDRLLDDLALALNSNGGAEWSVVEEFLGYPPVVSAIAHNLAVENFSAASSLLQRSQDTAQRPVLRGELLEQVIEEILDRETSKVQARVGDSLGMRTDGEERVVLYGRDEQSARLSKISGTVGVEMNHPAALSAHERAAYEEKIESFVLDHPFLRGKAFANAVFSDYVRAWAVASPQSELFAAARGPFLATLPKVGPFFTHFLHAQRVNEAGVSYLPEALVDDAIHSYSLSLENAHAVYAYRKGSGVLLLHDDLQRLSNLDQNLAFEVVEASGVLTLSGPIARSVLVTEGILALSGPEGRLQLGPDVSMIADEIAFDAKSVQVVSGGREYSSWTMLSANEATHEADLKVSSTPERALAISWKDPWFQWEAFKVKLLQRQETLPPSIAAQILLGIRRVLGSFRGSMRDDPSVHVDKVDRVVVGNNPTFAATFVALRDLGLVAKEGNLYRLNLTRMAEFGISWSSLRGDDPAAAMAPLFEEVAKHEEIQGLS